MLAAGDPARVLTWNLWWRFGDWQRRQEAISATLTKLRPDVCGLQEVWASPEENQAELLARQLQMHWVFTPSPDPGRWQQRLGDSSVAFGNAVLSRWPITTQDSLTLPAPAGQDPTRTLTYAKIDAPGGPIPFFTTQLDSAPQESAIRCAQVRAIACFVASRLQPEHPPVLTGDLNAEPDADEVRLLSGHKTAPAVPGMVLIDAWRYADHDQPGWTWDRANPHVRATLEPSARIDYVLVGPPANGARGHVRNVALVADRPTDGTWPSDHCAVLAELQQ